MSTEYRIKRYYVYFVISIISLTLPFIKINENHLFLLSFDHKQLHLLGMAFDMQELYMMPFLLMLLFLGIFAITAIGGRVWCGWACPQTIFRVVYRDLIETKIFKLRRIKNKQKEIDYSKSGNKIKKGLSILIWSFLSLIAASNFMWYFVPPEDFFQYIQNPTEHKVLLGFIIGITLFLIYDVVKLQEDFCVYVCPYSRVQSVLYDNDTIQAIYSEKRGGKIYNEEKEKIVWKTKDLEEQNECTTCEKCVTVCPTHIDIRKGMQLECINCLECVDACTSVMGNLGKESLVQWTSTNNIINGEPKRLIRPKSIAYGVVLLIIMGMLVIMGGKKEYMLLNINKSGQNYNIKENNVVANNYIYLFQNTQNEKYTYDLELIGENAEYFEIKRFKPFTLSPKKLSKKIVILQTKNTELAKNNSKPTIYKLKMRSFAKENPKEISVVRTFTFIYPGKKEIK